MGSLEHFLVKKLRVECELEVTEGAGTQLAFLKYGAVSVGAANELSRRKVI